MIKLIAIGHLGKDCTTNQVGGKNVINFSVAHTEKWKGPNNEDKEKTIWVECANWTDKTGIVPYLKKGTQVYVEGIPDVRTWQSQGGQSGASLTLRVLSIQLLGGNGANSNNANTASDSGQANTNQQPVNKDIVDDLPF